jgi:hypothetical protein
MEATSIFSHKLVALFQLQPQDVHRHLEFHRADQLVLLVQPELQVLLVLRQTLARPV